MSRRPSSKLVWSLRRYTRDGNLWDRVCEQCKECTAAFEYEHRDEDEGLLFGCLCDTCAQRELAGWLQTTQSSERVYPASQTAFDIANVFYEQKNDGETRCSRVGVPSSGAEEHKGAGSTYWRRIAPGKRQP